jgi:DNA-directed RNA polymerase subunit L
MAKTVRIQVLMTPTEYHELVTYCRDHKVNIKNDSDMLNKMLREYMRIEDSVKMTMYAMKQQIQGQKDIINKLKEELDYVKTIKKQNKKK